MVGVRRAITARPPHPSRSVSPAAWAHLLTRLDTASTEPGAHSLPTEGSDHDAPPAGRSPLRRVRPLSVLWSNKAEGMSGRIETDLKSGRRCTGRCCPDSKHRLLSRIQIFDFDVEVHLLRNALTGPLRRSVLIDAALGAPLGALMPDRGGGGDEHVSGASVTAVLLERWDLEPGPVEVYRATVDVGPQRSDAHAPGVEETVTVAQGRVLVGPLDAPRELRAGESHRCAGDVPHTFTAVADPAQIVLLMHYPSRDTSTEEGRDHHDR